MNHPKGKEIVLEALKECYDPEIPINMVLPSQMVNHRGIVELGLVYGVEVKEDSVEVEMTLTTQGWPDFEGCLRLP